MMWQYLLFFVCEWVFTVKMNIFTSNVVKLTRKVGMYCNTTIFVSNETNIGKVRISSKEIEYMIYYGKANINSSLLNKVYCNIYSLLFLFLAFYYQRWWLKQKCKANNILLTDNSIFTRETKYKSILSILVNQWISMIMHW